MASHGLIITSVLVVVLGYTLYTPLPDGIAEPWKLRIILANVKIVHAVTYVGEKLGVDTRVNLTRRAFEMISSFSSRDSRVQASDHSFDGVKVRIYRPKDEANTVLPGLVYYHGGGWAYFSVDSYDALTSFIAAEANIAVVSVDYKLAPEYPFPRPFDDCVTATVHLLRNAKNYKIDAHRIGIAGDEAGGNLAAAIANRLSFELRLPRIKFQALLCPMVQSFDFNTPSYKTNDLATPDIANRQAVVASWLYYYKGHLENLDQFLINNHTAPLMKLSEYAQLVNHDLLPETFLSESQEKASKDFGDPVLSLAFEDFLLNPYANPLMALEMTVLPPAFVTTSEFDVVRDDGFFYSHRLVEANVTTNHKHYEGGFHLLMSHFDSLWEVDVSRAAAVDLVIYIKTAFNINK